MLKKLIPLTLCLLITGTSMRAQTLQQCYEWTEENSPLVEKYHLIEKSKDYSLTAAKQLWLPQVTLSAQGTYQSDVSAFPSSMSSLFSTMGLEFEGLNKDQYRVSLDVSQTIWDGGTSKAKAEIAETEAEINVKDVESQIYTLRERVNSLFFGILMLEENLKLNEEMGRVLESNIRTMTALLDNGAASQSSLDALKVEEIQCRQDRKSIEATKEAYVNMLSLLTGHEITGLKEPEEPQIVAGWENRPDIQALELRKKNIEARALALNASKKPRFSAFAQGFYGNPGLNMFEDMLESHFSWNYMVGLRMQWNLTNFFTSRNEKSQLDNALYQIESDREILDFNYSLQTAEQNSLVYKMRDVLAEDEEIIRLRISLRETREAEVQNGVASVNDLISEISSENSAKLNASSLRIELLKNLYDLKITNNN